MEAETGGRRAGAKLRRTLWVLCGLLPFAAGRLYNQVLLEGEGLAAPALPAWTGFFARHMGLTVGGISCITNMAAGILEQPLCHEEVQETAEKVEDSFTRLVSAVLAGL